MTRSRALQLLICAGLVGGCAGGGTVTSNDVFRLEQCPDAQDCKLIADGVSQIPIQACVPKAVKHRAAGLDLALKTSAGSWLLPADPTTPTSFTASLSSDRCVTAILVAPSNTLEVRVDGELAGYRQSLLVPLRAAPLARVELTTEPSTLQRGKSDQISVHATVRADNAGTPTSGTTVAFTVTAKPDGAYAALWPTTTTIDATGVASTSLVVGPAASSVTVTATATGPSSPGGPKPPSATETGTLQAWSVDAGTADAAAE